MVANDHYKDRSELSSVYRGQQGYTSESEDQGRQCLCSASKNSWFGNHEERHIMGNHDATK